MSARAQVGRTLLMATALLLTSAPASPSGIELAWNQCYGQVGAQTTRTSACATDAGSQTMIVSFWPPSGITALEGVEVSMGYQIMGGSLRCWWNFAAGQLRQAQLTPLPVSPTDANGNPLVLCDNHYFLDRGATGGGWMTVTGPDQGQLRGVASIPARTGLPVAEGQQYAFGFRILNGSTTGGSCAGCLNAGCFIADVIRLYSSGKPDVTLVSPHPASDNWVTWQASPAATNCPGADQPPVPVLPHTWGAIKSIYR